MAALMKNRPQTLVQLLRGRAEKNPDQLAYRFLHFSGSGTSAEAATITYAQLDRWCRAIAGALREKAAPGDRALLLCPPGLEYLANFFGCLYAGLIAVPAYPPTAGRHFARVQAIAEDAEASIVIVGGVSDLADIPVPSEDDGVLGRAHWTLAGGGAPDGREESWVPEALTGDHVAFLQYTSGSTAAPKGVMVTHANLLANAQSAQTSFRMSTESVAVSWLPPYHDMGLIGGIIFPLYTGFPITLMSPTSFIRNPARWLQAITDCRATVSPGPNFAYQMCVDRIGDDVIAGLDLSSWECAQNGAEPIRPDVLERFVAKFGRCGFRRSSFFPCYGLAEGTLVVSGEQGPEPPVVRYVSRPDLEAGRFRPPRDLRSAHPLAGSGRAAEGIEVAIVDPETRQRSAPGAVGEIWVRGGSVATGYFRAEEATERTFRAYLTDGTGPFLRTGDLGVLEDGELFVTGRSGDLMIFRGRNVYPQDVEATCERAHDALGSARSAAFSVEEDGEDVLVIVQELPRGRMSDARMADVRAAIRRAVSEEHQLQTHEIVLVPARKLPITSSGKIQRRACKAQYLRGELPAIRVDAVDATPAAPSVDARDADPDRKGDAPEPAPVASGRTVGTVAEVQRRITALVSGLTRRPEREIDPDEPFTVYGLDSVQAVKLAGDLSEWLGREVPATLVWDHPSVRSAARALVAEGRGAVAVPVAEAAAAEPVAVVGAGCRFPGGAGVDAFWDLLVRGGCGVGEVPPDRWNVSEFFAPDAGVEGRMYSRHGGFVDGVGDFDAGLFGISAREAMSMDPQHRLMLEVSWEALEHAGVAPDGLRGSRTGVFVGAGGSDFERMSLLSGDVSSIDGYAATGSAVNFVANRLSYALGLEGPSLVVDTACSSSLVAVHLAVQSLRAGECDLALAGGVNVLLSPVGSVALCQGRMLSAAGACRTFDADADGYVRGEGCGVVVLRRLSQAKADGDQILAVIRGSAVNQDGRSNGLTAPNGLAQEKVIGRALAAARIYSCDVGYFEAHGTGTPLGDPIEMRALARVLGAGRDRRVAVGSVKTNIGHLEAAAGIAGLIKAVLAVERGVIPPHLNLSRPSPHIPWDELPVWVPTEATPWNERRRIAGVSSFGFGGTNAHAIVENFAVDADEVVGVTS